MLCSPYDEYVDEEWASEEEIAQYAIEQAAYDYARAFPGMVERVLEGYGLRFSDTIQRNAIQAAGCLCAKNEHVEASFETSHGRVWYQL